MTDDNDLLRAGLLDRDPFRDCKPWTPATGAPVGSNGPPAPPASDDQEAPWRTDAQTLEAVEQADTEWLWKDRIPLGMVTVLFGAKAVGKGMIATNLICAVTTGGMMPTGRMRDGEIEFVPVTEGKVLYLNAEDPVRQTIVPRLQGADLSKVVHPSSVERVNAETGHADRRILTLAGPERTTFWWDHILAEIERHDPVLFVVDTVFSHAGADVKANEEMGPVMGRLAIASEQYRMATLLIHHPVKAPHTRASSDASGATCITTTARSVLMAGADDQKTRRALFHLDSNVGPEASPIGYVAHPFAWTGATDLTVDEVRRHKPTKGPSQRERAVRFVQRTLDAGPMKVSKLERLGSEEKPPAKPWAITAARRAIECPREKIGEVWWTALPEHKEKLGVLKAAAVKTKKETIQ
ncbi:MAG: AAA family ATPase [Planctomycetota bacterium]|jgi:hypothetical protein